jgi:hypothetical protein
MFVTCKSCAICLWHYSHIGLKNWTFFSVKNVDVASYAVLQVCIECVRNIEDLLASGIVILLNIIIP